MYRLAFIGETFQIRFCLRSILANEAEALLAFVRFKDGIFESVSQRHVHAAVIPQRFLPVERVFGEVARVSGSAPEHASRIVEVVARGPVLDVLLERSCFISLLKNLFKKKNTKNRTAGEDVVQAGEFLGRKNAEQIHADAAAKVVRLLPRGRRFSHQQVHAAGRDDFAEPLWYCSRQKRHLISQ
jgi:hypothetical protein